jgi:hypothetical protein
MNSARFFAPVCGKGKRGRPARNPHDPRSVDPDRPWMTTLAFLAKLDDNLKIAMK